MLHLVYSQASEALLDALVERLDRQRHRPGRSPLEPDQLLVPSRTIETWVKLGLARSLGIAANLRADGFGRFLGRLAEESGEPLWLIDRAALEGALLEIFLDPERLAHPELAPPREYLFAGGDTPEVVDTRRQQLAAELAGLFDAYLLHRPDFLHEWPERTLYGSDPLFGPIERWERRLFLMIFQRDGILDQHARRQARRWLLPFELIDQLPEHAPLPEAVHVFGFSYLPVAHYRLLERLARRAEVHVFAFNPTASFWEEASAPTAAPLKRWGRGGRENVRALSALTSQAEERYVDSPGRARTLLEQLQRDILQGELEPAPDPARWADDKSMRVLACPGVRREVEAVAEEVWRVVLDSAQDPEPIRFNEIAVLLCDRQDHAYAAHVTAVFREADEIPFNIIDLPLAAESRIIEAVDLLLDLPLGDFRRNELLRLVTHPAVIARFPDVEPVEWIDWCDELAIVHGGDQDDHRRTYIDKDLYNWDQGLRRLTLGAFMGGGREGEAPIHDAGGQHYLPEEVPGTRTASAARLALLVRSLIADARFMKQGQHTLAEWAELLELIITTYVVPTGDQDLRVLRRCIRAISDLTTRDLGDVRLSYPLVRELVRSSLGGMTGGRGQHLAEGVVVGSYLPMRAVPFKVIFVLGLGAGRFPGTERRSQLDLRGAAPRATDVSAEDRDRYLFLETILAARERLYLTFESRDPLTGEPIEPSLVIRELFELLDRGYLGPGGSERTILETLRLRRFDVIEPRTPQVEAQPDLEPEPEARYRLPGARREIEADRRGAAFERQHGRAPAADDVAEDPEGRSRHLRRVLGLVTLPQVEAPRHEPRAPLSISLSRIRTFLECPLQGSARTLLRLEEDERDPYAHEDEPFSTAPSDRAVALRRVFWHTVAGAAARADELKVPVERLYEEYARARQRLELRGASPTGVFAAVEELDHRRTLAGWLKELENMLARGGSGVRLPFAFGRAEESAEVSQVLDPLRLEIEVTLAPGRIERRWVEITGKTEALLLEPWTSISLVVRDNEPRRDNTRELRDSLRAFLDHVMLSATERRVAPHRAMLLMPRRPFARFFPAISPEEARAFLARTVSAMLSRVHGYVWPFEAVAWLRDGRSYEWIRDQLQRDLDRGAGPYLTFWGPVPQPSRYPVASEEEAQLILRERFGLFFGDEGDDR